MSRTYHENKFPEMDYEDFYTDHYYEPVSDDDAINAHRIFPRVAWALDIAKETRPRSVLDLGCLEGYAALTIAKHVDSVKKGWGVDLSQDGIISARKRTSKLKADLRFQIGLIETFLEKTKEKFDLVMLFEVIEHVKDPAAMLKQIDKVLAPGGSVLISTPAFESPTFGKDDEQNKCHVRLYTTQDDDYEEVNKYGNLRKATSIYKEIGYGDAKRGHERTISCDIFSELIHIRYQ
jgi:2-polyprenyl-3-methyl-5-hydroxy-6-metoxy-1,4-benzoquinol methylase